MKRKKGFTEKEMRANMLREAREYGCHRELQQIFDETDKKLIHCTNLQERQLIAVEAIRLIEMLMTSTPDDLIINGQTVKMK